MITIQDIHTAVATSLTKNGHLVTANEVVQGFKKPTFFINVLPVSTESQGKVYELVTFSVELIYHPEIETREELLYMVEKLKQLFFYEPLSVEDRFISPNEITFDIDNNNLITYFEITFMQETNLKEQEYPKMIHLQTEVNKHFTSSQTQPS